MKIKVIKKKSIVESFQKVETVPSARESARAMVSNVSEWVVEFKARKSAETKAAVENLLGSSPRTSEF